MSPQTFSIPSTDGVMLTALLTGNRVTDKATILFAHGWTGNKDEAYGYFSRLAENLMPHNIVSLRFDARGHGESVSPQGLPFTIDGYAQDIAACCAWLRKQNPATHIFAFGFSLGGLAVLQANDGHNFTGLILASPILNGRDQLERFADDIGTLQSELHGVTPQKLAVKANEVGTPILFIQGGADDDCLPVFAHSFAEACRLVDYHELPLMTHLYTAPDDIGDYGRALNRSAQSEANLVEITRLIVEFVA